MHAGGGQGSATAIKTMIARFTTVANGTFATNDSAVLPASAAGLEITVINAAAANTMDVFPASGENINGLANNIQIPVPAGSVVTFYCTVAGAWHALFTPTGTSVSMRLAHSGGRPPFASAPATDAGLFNATPVSTETYVSEIIVPLAGTATGVGILNGSAVSGNVTVYLLDLSGQQIAKSASTAQSGTTAYQRVSFSAAKFITPGTYYLGLQVDNGTGRYTGHVFGDFGGGKFTGTTYGTFPSGQTMPTTFTANVAPVAHLSNHVDQSSPHARRCRRVRVQHLDRRVAGGGIGGGAVLGLCRARHRGAVRHYQRHHHGRGRHQRRQRYRQQQSDHRRRQQRARRHYRGDSAGRRRHHFRRLHQRGRQHHVHALGRRRLDHPGRLRAGHPAAGVAHGRDVPGTTGLVAV
jgi:hypothetical protein